MHRVRFLTGGLCGISAALALWFAGCSGGGSEETGSDAGVVADAGTAESDAGTSVNDAGGGTGDAGTGNDDAGTSTHCPTVVLPSTTSVKYDGNTTGKPNIVESQRLEWTTAGDDALLFDPPSTGTYRIAMPTLPDANGCGASIQEANDTFYDASWCPAPGAVKSIDGVFVAAGGLSGDVALTGGTSVLIWVSCTEWSGTKEGAYSLTIDKQ